jgi:hypothetical protein
MNQKFPQEDAIRQYLLGTLDPSKCDEIEERLLSSEELSQTAEVMEDEIIEQYLDGELGDSEKRAVETHFLRPPEHRQKMRFAAMLRNRLKQGSADVAKDLPRIQPFPAPRPRPLWTYGGYAAAVVLAGLSGSLAVMQTLSRNAQNALRTELAQERERSAGLKEQLRALQTPSGKTLDLQPGIARSGGMVPEITLPPAPQRIRIELVLPYPSSALFHVRLRRNGSEVWSETRLKATPSSSASTLVFEAPVESGKYDLIVTPEANPNGQITYPFDAKIAQ